MSSLKESLDIRLHKYCQMNAKLNCMLDIEPTFAKQIDDAMDSLWDEMLILAKKLEIDLLLYWSRYTGVTIAEDV